MFPNAATLRVRCSPRDEYRRSSCIAASFGVDLQSLRSTNLIAISAIVLRCNTHVMLRCNMTLVDWVARLGAISAAGRETGAISARLRPPDLFSDIDLSEDRDPGTCPGGARPGVPWVTGSGCRPSTPTLRQLGDPLRGPPRGALRALPTFGGALRSVFFDLFVAPSSLAPRDPRKVEKNRLQTPQKLQVSVGVGGLRPLT